VTTVRFADSPTDQLARQIVQIDRKVTEAAREHRWYDAADLEATRAQLVEVRYHMLRREWLERRPV
jgi:hypothetical protein